MGSGVKEPYEYRHDELDDTWRVNRGGNMVVNAMTTRMSGFARTQYPDGSLSQRTLHPNDSGGYEPGPLRSSGPDSNLADLFQMRNDTRERNGAHPKLFETVDHPPREELTDLHASAGHQVAAMTLVGMAQNWNQQQFGRSLVPSDSLSVHSARMVSHLKEAGAVAPDAPDQRSNAITDFPKPYRAGYYNTSRDRIAEPGEVRRGRNTIRSVLGRRRTSFAEQGQQGSLF